MRFFHRRGKAKQPRFLLGEAGLSYAFQAIFGQPTDAGVSVNAAAVRAIPTVYACINAIAKPISSMPLGFYSRLASPVGSQSGRVRLTGNNLDTLVSLRPNSEMTAFSFRMAMQSALCLHNNAYAQIRRRINGTVAELIPVHPSKVTISRKAGELVYKVEGVDDPFTQRDMLHLRGATRDGLMGIDIPTELREAFGLAIALDRNAASFFGNNSRPGLVLDYPGQLTDPAYNRLKESIDSKLKGSDKAFSTLILEDGLKLAASAQLRQNNQDSQFDESRERQDRMIARVMGVPPHKIGIMDNLPRANIEEQNIAFLTDVLTPIAVCWEQALALSILPDSRLHSHEFHFDFTELARANTAERYKAAQTGVVAGIISRQEGRQMVDKNPGPDHLEQFLVPVNMAVVGEDGAPKALNTGDNNDHEATD